MFLLGLAIALISVGFAAVLLGGDLSTFIDAPSLVIILGPILAVLTATNSFKVFCKGLRVAASPKETISKEMCRQGVLLFRLLSKTVGFSAVIATLISFINILMNLDFSSRDGIVHLGVNIAASFMSLLYGFLLIVAMFEPAGFILRKRLQNDNKRRYSII